MRNGYEALAQRRSRPLRYLVGHLVGADAITDKATVKSVQAQLQLIAKNSGNKALDPGVADGVIGPKTKAALTAFNITYGWPSDGASLTKGTLEALARPDVVRLTQGDTPVTSVIFTDNETVVARKYVVEQVKQANDAVQTAADAKAKATTPAEKAAADAQAKAAQAQADRVAAAATAAPPEVKQAAALVQSAAQATVQAQTPVAIAAAQGQVSAANEKVKSVSKTLLWVPIAIGLVSLLGIGTTIALAANSKWLWAALTFFLFTPAVAAGAGLTAGAIAAKGVA